MDRHLQQHCHTILDEPAQSHFGLAPQTHNGKGKSEDYFFHLFLKALGYFLLPSSFFPEQEFTTPHGFLGGEVGEKSKGRAAGFLPPPYSPGCSSCVFPPNSN